MTSVVELFETVGLSDLLAFDARAAAKDPARGLTDATP
jgi:hypothetical protein